MPDRVVLGRFWAPYLGMECCRRCALHQQAGRSLGSDGTNDEVHAAWGSIHLRVVLSASDPPAAAQAMYFIHLPS